MTNNDHLNIIRVLQSVYSGKKIFVECFPTDNGAITFPNSNMAVKEVSIPELPDNPVPQPPSRNSANEFLKSKGVFERYVELYSGSDMKLADLLEEYASQQPVNDGI